MILLDCLEVCPLGVNRGPSWRPSWLSWPACGSLGCLFAPPDLNFGPRELVWALSGSIFALSGSISALFSNIFAIGASISAHLGTGFGREVHPKAHKDAKFAIKCQELQNSRLPSQSGASGPSTTDQPQRQGPATREGPAVNRRRRLR